MVNVIIPAGGKSERYSKKTSKLDEIIHTKSVLHHTLSAFVNNAQINQIAIAIPEAEEKKYKQVCKSFNKKIIITPGGRSRAESVHNAFQQLDACKFVLIHDAARPNVSQELINTIISELNTHKVVIPGIPVTDTIKKVSSKNIIETVDRNELVAVQTPQGFHYSDLQAAYKSIHDLSMITDEAGLMEQHGIFGRIIEGEKENIKVTHPIDLTILNSLL